ncbi:NIF system FeS cluster assembly, NifU-like protein [Candidatus Magnetoovum chiemensis]|nr:NIF system FeS cluster assembly, NifU-like protein [Candidatus Magnetoovum chiemensis]
MDHFTNPRNVGEIQNADGIGMEGNPTCGDAMKLFIKVEDNKITEAKFQTFGCGAAIAVSSMITEMVVGKTIEEALLITKESVADALDGLPPQKMHCSNLGADALHKAIEDYRNRHS